MLQRPKARKRAADEDAALVEEAKRACVEHHSEGLQGSPPPVVNVECCEDETGAHARSASRLVAVGASTPSSGQEVVAQGSLTGDVGRGAP